MNKKFKLTRREFMAISGGALVQIWKVLSRIFYFIGCGSHTSFALTASYHILKHYP